MRHIQKCPNCSNEMEFLQVQKVYFCRLCNKVVEPEPKTFDQVIQEIIANYKPCQPEKNVVFYNPDGDIIQVYFKVPVEQAYYAEWVSPLLTLYRDHGTKEIVGFEICGAKTFAEKLNKAMKEEGTSL